MPSIQASRSRRVSDGLHDVVEHRGLISAERRSDHRGKLRATQLVLSGEGNRVERIERPPVSDRAGRCSKMLFVEFGSQSQLRHEAGDLLRLPSFDLGPGSPVELHVPV
jgi:hypothetical protein